MHCKTAQAQRHTFSAEYVSTEMYLRVKHFMHLLIIINLLIMKVPKMISAEYFSRRTFYPPKYIANKVFKFSVLTVLSYVEYKYNNFICFWLFRLTFGYLTLTVACFARRYWHIKTSHFILMITGKTFPGVQNFHTVSKTPPRFLKLETPGFRD